MSLSVVTLQKKEVYPTLPVAPKKFKGSLKIEVSQEGDATPVAPKKFRESLKIELPKADEDTNERLKKKDIFLAKLRRDRAPLYRVLVLKDGVYESHSLNKEDLEQARSQKINAREYFFLVKNPDLAEFESHAIFMREFTRPEYLRKVALPGELIGTVDDTETVLDSFKEVVKDLIYEGYKA